MELRLLVEFGRKDLFPNLKPHTMSKTTKSTLKVQGASVAVITQNRQDYISLTDMAKKFGDDALIYSWMRNRNTLEFIGIWEHLPILMTPPNHKPQNRQAKIPRYLASRMTENTIWRLWWSH